MHIIIDPDHMEMVFPDAVDLKVIFSRLTGKAYVWANKSDKFIFHLEISF